MLRKLTSNEKSCKPGVDYVFECNGCLVELSEERFRQLAFEASSLLNELLSDKWKAHFERSKKNNVQMVNDKE